MGETLEVKDRLNKITAAIVDAAFQIHSKLGPGLLESVYVVLMEMELRARGFMVERQVPITFKYNGVTFEHGFTADLIVERMVVVEIKAREKTNYVFERQLMTYLKLLDYRVGLLINFGEVRIKDGIRRLVNNF